MGIVDLPEVREPLWLHMVESIPLVCSTQQGFLMRHCDSKISDSDPHLYSMNDQCITVVFMNFMNVVKCRYFSLLLTKYFNIILNMLLNSLNADEYLNVFNKGTVYKSVCMDLHYRYFFYHVTPEWLGRK